MITGVLGHGEGREHCFPGNKGVGCPPEQWACHIQPPFRHEHSIALIRQLQVAMCERYLYLPLCDGLDLAFHLLESGALEHTSDSLLGKQCILNN